jgi:VWFA-related protein
MKSTSFREPLYFLLLLLLIFTLLRMSAGAQQEGPVKPTSPDQPAQQAPPPPKPAPPPETNGPGFAISLTVPVVNVDVVATDSDGNYLRDLKKENFRITEDGAPQIITNFSTGDAPITVALLVEYSRMAYGFYLYDAQKWADIFLRQLKPQDWVALESFNMKTNVEVDFTHDAKDVEQGLISLRDPVFTESNIFDALTETVDRMRDVKGKKAILVLASGQDTFSKLTLDKTLAKLKESDITIFCVGVGEQYALEQESHGGIGTNSLTHIQADNQLKAFADLTGGRSWFPRFDGEIPGVMSDVATSLRNQYSLAYTPSNQATDGKYRKIKVELLDNDGKPLVLTNEKGKKVKYQLYARQGYVAPKSAIN